MRRCVGWLGGKKGSDSPICLALPLSTIACRRETPRGRGEMGKHAVCEEGKR